MVISSSSVVGISDVSMENMMVATPTFSPPSGTYKSVQTITVTLSTATAGAILRYTTDGKDPTEESEIYTAPITISTTTVIKAKAWMTGMTQSNMATAIYMLPNALYFDTWRLIEDLPGLNSQFTGSTIFPPHGADCASGDGYEICVKYNGFDLEILESDGMYRAAYASPLIQTSGGGSLTYTIDNERNTIHIVDTFKYTICTSSGDDDDGGGDGGNTGGWFSSLSRYEETKIKVKEPNSILRFDSVYVEKSPFLPTYNQGTKPLVLRFDDGGGEGDEGGEENCTTYVLTVDRTYSIPPIHPSTLIDNNMPIMGYKRDGRVLVFPLGNLTELANVYRYNFNIQINESDDTRFAEVRHMAYRIDRDENHYYGVPVWLAPWSYQGRAYRVRISYNTSTEGKIVTLLDRPLEVLPLERYDAFGSLNLMEYVTINDETTGDYELVQGKIVFWAIFAIGIFFLIKERGRLVGD